MPNAFSAQRHTLTAFRVAITEVPRHVAVGGGDKTHGTYKLDHKRSSKAKFGVIYSLLRRF